MNLKEKLYHHCLDYVNQRLQVCENRIASIKEDLFSETKSSAGDKHETGRAMLQLEREKLGHQLATIEQEKKLLANFNPDAMHTQVRLGSIVKTTQQAYFLLISAGIIKVDTESFISISPQSPIGQLMISKTVGDTVTFRENTFEIVEVS
ncbi:3-oxoacyl-ACP synthase [Flavobacteriaceae bacterium Ap0902]|nr:3-oxoacyl-ACP synthase [Flavobacteriaceae bacterium Ap0902]